MKIGIVSDSHGRVGPLRRAIAALVNGGAEAIVHCGDIGSAACVEALAETSATAYAVCGNTDRHIDSLAQEARRCGVNFHPRSIEVPLGDGRFLVATHGDDDLLADLVAGGQFPYVCHGHTHRIRDEEIDGVRVICPGALRHPRNPRHPTAALLDTRTGLLACIDVR